jgi:H+-transporting ATPase
MIDQLHRIDAMTTGLTSEEAKSRLGQFGLNAIAEEKRHPLIDFIKNLWGPIPWMLEISLVLDIFLQHFTQTIIISLLLIFNAFISFFQERRAHDALELLQKRLTVRARVLRDGNWQQVPADQLVPGDVIHMRMGDVVPADVKVLEGHISADQSTLTGETFPVEVNPGETSYAGSILQHGEATCEVTTTGSHTYFGKTAELVRLARTASHLETTILNIIKYLVVMDAFLALVVSIYAWIHVMPLIEMLPFVLMLLIASVPIALPATFTLAAALGSQELAKNGILVTRLSAIEEAAAMDILCIDKTGTITKNQLTLAALHPYPPYTEEYLLNLAALGSDESSQDSIDLAILSLARQRRLIDLKAKLLEFIPFNPATKRTEAILEINGKRQKIIKGFPQVVATMAGNKNTDSDVAALAEKGYRVLAVATEGASGMELVGLLGLYDPPREDSAELIQKLRDDLSVRVIMVTGDSLETARSIAREVGLGTHICSKEAIHEGDGEFLCDVVAGVLPEDKIQLVKRFQAAGHVVGMTGDGVNDAPALKQAEVGIAVSNSTDVARAAASAVITDPGLTNILAAVKIGRQIYQRMLTYTYNKIIKTFQIALFLSLGLFITGNFVITPRLIVLLLFANDFVTMSLSSDNVSYSKKPDRWNIRELVLGSIVLALCWLVFVFGIYFFGRGVFHLAADALNTLTFLVLVFSGQANVYLVRERGHLWRSLPGRALLISSLADILIVSLLAIFGILMTPIPLILVLLVILTTALFTFLIDFIKVPLFRHNHGHSA